MIKNIKGNKIEDHRGSVRFVNNFDMTKVKRFYIIQNIDTQLVRGWRAHRNEQRWFYVLRGSFNMVTLEIDDWHKPSRDLPMKLRKLRASDQLVVHVPPGFATAFQALEADSELLVFANHGIEHASQDDYKWDFDYFTNNLF